MKKISFVTIIFIVITFIYVVLNRYEKIINTQLEENVKLTELIENHYQPQQERYEASLQRITEYIHATDSYLNVGGTWGEVPEYFDSEVYQEILDGIENPSQFNDFLSNVEYFFNERNEYLTTLPSIWPLKFSPYLRFTSQFGDRFSPFTGNIQSHGGIDLISTWRAQILATASGYVCDHWIYHQVYGKYIIIDHRNGYRTHYAHLSESYVYEGMEVTIGDVIGRMGDTGLANGMHLHYAISRYNEETNDWSFVDPIGFLREAMQ